MDQRKKRNSILKVRQTVDVLSETLETESSGPANDDQPRGGNMDMTNADGTFRVFSQESHAAADMSLESIGGGGGGGGGGENQTARLFDSTKTLVYEKETVETTTTTTKVIEERVLNNPNDTMAMFNQSVNEEMDMSMDRSASAAANDTIAIFNQTNPEEHDMSINQTMFVVPKLPPNRRNLNKTVNKTMQMDVEEGEKPTMSSDTINISNTTNSDALDMDITATVIPPTTTVTQNPEAKTPEPTHVDMDMTENLEKKDDEEMSALPEASETMAMFQSPARGKMPIQPHNAEKTNNKKSFPVFLPQTHQIPDKTKRESSTKDTKKPIPPASSQKTLFHYYETLKTLKSSSIRPSSDNTDITDPVVAPPTTEIQNSSGANNTQESRNVYMDMAEQLEINDGRDDMETSLVRGASKAMAVLQSPSTARMKRARQDKTTRRQDDDPFSPMTRVNPKGSATSSLSKSESTSGSGNTSKLNVVQQVENTSSSDSFERKLASFLAKFVDPDAEVICKMCGQSITLQEILRHVKRSHPTECPDSMLTTHQNLKRRSEMNVYDYSPLKLRRRFSPVPSDGEIFGGDFDEEKDCAEEKEESGEEEEDSYVSEEAETPEEAEKSEESELDDEDAEYEARLREMLRGRPHLCHQNSIRELSEMSLRTLTLRIIDDMSRDMGSRIMDEVNLLMEKSGEETVSEEVVVTAVKFLFSSHSKAKREMALEQIRLTRLSMQLKDVECSTYEPLQEESEEDNRDADDEESNSEPEKSDLVPDDDVIGE